MHGEGLSVGKKRGLQTQVTTPWGPMTSKEKHVCPPRTVTVTHFSTPTTPSVAVRLRCDFRSLPLTCWSFLPSEHGGLPTDSSLLRFPTQCPHSFEKHPAILTDSAKISLPLSFFFLSWMSLLLYLKSHFIPKVI